MPSRSGSQSPRRQKKQRKNSGRSNSSGSNSSRRSSSRSKEDRRRDHKEIEKVEPSSKLFVTNIDSKYSQEELDKQLRELFSPHGAIKNIVIKTKAGSANSYCFIEYDNIDDAKRAQQQQFSEGYRLKGKDFKGKELKVEFGRGERKAEDRRSQLCSDFRDKCYICHKEGHFAKDCKYNRYNDRYYGSRDPRSDDRNRYRKDRRDSRDRNYSGRDRDYDRRDRYDRDYRDRGQRKRKRSYSHSSRSSRSSYDHKRGRRDDYRRHKDHRSPEKRRHFRQNNRRYD